MTRVLAWFTWPFTILLGLRPEEWQIGADLLGSRFIETKWPPISNWPRCNVVTTSAHATVTYGHDLRVVRVRSCRQHGHFCRRSLRPDAQPGKGYIAPGSARVWTSFLVTSLPAVSPESCRCPSRWCSPGHASTSPDTSIPVYGFSGSGFFSANVRTVTQQADTAGLSRT